MWFRTLFNSLKSGRSRTSVQPARRRNVYRLTLEPLESRLAPAVHTWDDGSLSTNNWSDAANWDATGVPTTGEVGGTIVIIPINDPTSFQDIAGLVINQILFMNSGSATVTLLTPLGIDGSVSHFNIFSASGTNTITGSSLTLSGATCFIDLSASTMTIASAITGDQGICKVGTGLLELSTAVGNTYTGDTTVADGTLLLNTNTSDAGMSNNIVVGDGTGATSSAILSLETSFEIPDNATMTINRDGRVSLGGSGITEDLTTLTLNGGVLDIGNPRTFVIRAGGSVTTTAAATTSTIVGGSFQLLGTTTFTIADGAAATDLLISATVTELNAGSGLIKDGAGTLELAGTNANTYTGTTTVNDGVLVLNNDAIDGAVSKSLVIGDSTGAAGSAVVRLLQVDEIPDDGTITIHADGRLDLSGAADTIGLLTLDGGSSVTTGVRTLHLNNNVIVTAAGASSPATMTGHIDLGGSIRTFTVADGAADVDLQVGAIVFGGGLIAFDGGLIKDGPGRMVLTGANTYPGTTSVNAGVLEVEGSQPASAVSLTGDTLAGGGTVGPITATGGTIAPGLPTAAAPVILHSGNLVLGTSTFTPLISGTVGGAADQIAVTGTVNLTGATVAPIRTGSGPAVGQTFRVIDNDAADPVVGTFVGLPEGATLLVNGQTFVVTYRGGDGNDVVLTRIGNVLVTGLDAGAAPRVRVFDAVTRAQKFNFLAYPASFTGGVRVASADVNGDGYPDIVTAPGKGTVAVVKVFSGATAAGHMPKLLYQFKPYGGFTGGVFVAVGGDVNGDHIPDIITAPAAGRAPVVNIFSGANGSLLSSFLAFGSTFKGGVTVAAGDVNGDGTLDIVAGMATGAPRVRVFDAATHAQLSGAIGNFLAYAKTFTGGVFVAAGDVNGDGRAEVITGPGPGLAPTVKVFTPTTVAAPRVLAAFAATAKKGVRVATADLDGDGILEILAALGPGGTANVRMFNKVSPAAIARFFAESTSFTHGLFVSGT
jgi:fibronectin-binding autotransporter adhesin